MNIAFVPVRCGSKSIKFKNIRDFCGKPLVYWCLNALEKSRYIDKIFLATDCDEIKSIINKFSFSKVDIFNRNKDNASDFASTESVMLEFLDQHDCDNDDLFILVQATSPFIQVKDIDGAFSLFKKDKADSLLSCVRSKRFLWKENGTPLNYDYLRRPRRQEFKGTLMENGAFYINFVKNIKQSESRLSGKISIYEMDEFSTIEIDEEDDWIVAERLMYKNILNKKLLPNIKLFLSDVDGTLTDAGMYYGENGEELKKFNTHDGKAFELLKAAGIKTGIITSEKTKIVKNRAKKIKADFLYQGLEHRGKLDIVKKICRKEKITLEEVAYIGDDINCKELLEKVGVAACPFDAIKDIKEISKIVMVSKKGGNGAVREFAEFILSNKI
jgi:YrbI family 3-deoxy-D-manno-octulosonate 8-phosphate phosphatase